jgi:dihydroorotate dehydrogenase
VTISLLKSGLAPTRGSGGNDMLTQTLWGREFANPLGIAAGFDKNAEVPDALFGLGFGFVEVGAVTPRPQAGNPKPRLFRLSEDRAVINRMGFNNDGLDAVRTRLAARKGSATTGPLGVNLGANKDSEDRSADYAACASALADLVDFLVVNVSSPNTPGLRELQDPDHLAKLLDGVRTARDEALPSQAEKPPVLVKIAPDFEPDELNSLARTLAALAVDGIIVSNTSVALRDGLQSRYAGEQGGVSGRPLFDLSTLQLQRVYQATEGRVPLVGVGGIESAETAYRKIRAGASLLQLYSALVFQGTGLIGEILQGLPRLLQRDGFQHLSEAVGADVRGD